MDNVKEMISMDKIFSGFAYSHLTILRKWILSSVRADMI